jgi:hypothetical protein
MKEHIDIHADFKNYGNGNGKVKFVRELNLKVDEYLDLIYDNI